MKLEFLFYILSFVYLNRIILKLIYEKLHAISCNQYITQLQPFIFLETKKQHINLLQQEMAKFAKSTITSKSRFVGTAKH